VVGVARGDAPARERSVKIAVIGAGVAGLACALRLGARHEVTLFEAAQRLGGHAHTVDALVAGRVHAVDTGFIVYNETTYPAFTRLLAELGVASQPAEMSFGLRCARSGLEWSSRGLRGLFATPGRALRPDFVRMLGEIARFAREAPQRLAAGDEKSTLRELASGGGYSAAFVDWYLAPMGAAIWSASVEDLLDMPAVSFVRFFHNHGLLGAGGTVRWRTLCGGSRAYVCALAQRVRGPIRRGERVHRVGPDAGGGVAVATDAGSARFDRAVLAVHADEALALLSAPTDAQRRVLGAFRYSRNEAVLHTDASLLPRRAAARASWNYAVPARASEPVLVTYDLSRLQQIPSSEPLLVTLNGAARIAPERVLGRFHYSHPILDAAALAAQREHAAIDGVQGIHFCGAHWGWGFHEDGLQSALRVVAALEGSA
jgi:predicted NAD/FAD-binding protein